VHKGEGHYAVSAASVVGKGYSNIPGLLGGGGSYDLLKSEWGMHLSVGIDDLCC
jgi:hypothetical protein